MPLCGFWTFPAAARGWHLLTASGEGVHARIVDEHVVVIGALARLVWRLPGRSAGLVLTRSWLTGQIR